MKYALISPQELIRDGETVVGFRVCQVVDSIEETFSVAAPFVWDECDDDIVPDQFYWREDRTLQPMPVRRAPEKTREQALIEVLLEKNLITESELEQAQRGDTADDPTKRTSDESDEVAPAPTVRPT